MSGLRAATTGATTASASFSSAIGTPNLPIRVRARANTMRCNNAGGKTRHAARWAARSTAHRRASENAERSGTPRATLQIRRRSILTSGSIGASSPNTWNERHRSTIRRICLRIYRPMGLLLSQIRRDSRWNAALKKRNTTGIRPYPVATCTAGGVTFRSCRTLFSLCVIAWCDSAKRRSA